MNPHGITGPSDVTNRQRLRWGLVVFAAIALYFLLAEHRAHVFAALPWLLLLACPAMHLFMHRGHRSHKHEAPGSAGAQPGPRSDQAHEEHAHAGHGCC